MESDQTNAAPVLHIGTASRSCSAYTTTDQLFEGDNGKSLSALLVRLSAVSLSRIFLRIEQPTYQTENHYSKPPLCTIRTGATVLERS